MGLLREEGLSRRFSVKWYGALGEWHDLNTPFIHMANRAKVSEQEVIEHLLTENKNLRDELIKVLKCSPPSFVVVTQEEYDRLSKIDSLGQDTPVLRN